MHRWRYPSLSLHGIEGAFSEAGAKTVIPRKVNGKFSIRLVPDMDPKVVEKQVDLSSGSVHVTVVKVVVLKICQWNLKHDDCGNHLSPLVEVCHNDDSLSHTFLKRILHLQQSFLLVKQIYRSAYICAVLVITNFPKS